MSDKPTTGPSAGQWAAIGLFGVAALGVQISRELRKSPEQKREDRRKRRGRQALKREYGTRSREARRLDDDRWKQFEKDAVAQAAFNAERHTVIEAKPINAEVSYTRGSNYGHEWEKIEAVRGHESVRVYIDHDGGASIRYSNKKDAQADGYHSSFGMAHGYITIGEGLEKVSKVQKRTARFVAAMQEQGYFKGAIAIVEPGHSFDLKEEHYARFAKARGWPQARYGESKKVGRWYRDAQRFGWR